MNASELKYQVENHGHDRYFFTRDTMKFFGDTMRNYGVRKTIIKTYSGNMVDVWELYRKRPVKFNNKSSAYFNCETFAQEFKSREEEEDEGQE